MKYFTTESGGLVESSGDDDMPGMTEITEAKYVELLAAHTAEVEQTLRLGGDDGVEKIASMANAMFSAPTGAELRGEANGQDGEE